MGHIGQFDQHRVSLPLLYATDHSKQGACLNNYVAWVFPLEEYDEEEDDHAPATRRLLPRPPTDAQLAQHNHTPSASHNHGPPLVTSDAVKQDWSPESLESISNETGSRWKSFARVSAHPPAAQDRVERVTEEWLQEHGPDYSRPWHASAEDAEKAGHSHNARRKAWWRRFQHTVLRNPLVPLYIRLTLWVFSLIAMALAISIRHISVNPSTRDGPSTIMAISIDAVALVYILYITYDEYTAKPLGLRSAKAKMRLIFLDLFFIVFDSANMSLAFETATNLQGPCQDSNVNGVVNLRDGRICARQTALASVLLVALVAWLMTFSISVLR